MDHIIQGINVKASVAVRLVFIRIKMAEKQAANAAKPAARGLAERMRHSR